LFLIIKNSDKEERQVTFIEIAKVSEIPVGSMKGENIGGKDILIANYEGRYFAIGVICTQAGGTLARGILDVTCPVHGSTFDVTTGNRISCPAKQNERKYDLKVEGTVIKIDV